MAKIIATIKLAPGKVAFYDEYTKIHLTLSNPVANVYEGMNLKRIRMSVKSGSLRVISGSLTDPVIEEVKVTHKETPAPAATETKQKQVKEETVKTEIIVEDVAEDVAKAEEITEETASETLTAESVEIPENKPKRGRKSAKTTTDAETEAATETETETEA